MMRLTLLHDILTDNYMFVRGITCLYVCLMSPKCIFENHLVVPSLILVDWLALHLSLSNSFYNLPSTQQLRAVVIRVVGRDCSPKAHH